MEVFAFGKTGGEIAVFAVRAEGIVDAVFIAGVFVERATRYGSLQRGKVFEKGFREIKIPAIA